LWWFCRRRPCRSRSGSFGSSTPGFRFVWIRISSRSVVTTRSTVSEAQHLGWIDFDHTVTQGGLFR
jgi:hypothetical protein